MLGSLGCKIFLIINCQDYLYQEMELGEHKNGNHSSGGQGQGGASKPSPDPVGNVASGTVHLCHGHWGHGRMKKYLKARKVDKNDNTNMVTKVVSRLMTKSMVSIHKQQLVISFEIYIYIPL